MTTSRSGRSGILSRISNTSPSRSIRIMGVLGLDFVPGFLMSGFLAPTVAAEREDRLRFLFDDLAGDRASDHFEARWDFVHQIEHALFEDRAEPAGARAARSSKRACSI